MKNFKKIISTLPSAAFSIGLILNFAACTNDAANRFGSLFA